MSINMLLGNALSSLTANQAGLRVTSNNIANVNTPDYVRRQVLLEAASVAGQSAGVDVGEVRRVVDRFLQNESMATNSNANYYSAQAEFFDRLQGMLGRPDDGSSVDGHITDLFTALNALSNDPTSLPMRVDFLSQLSSLANSFSSLANDIQTLRGDANSKIVESIDRINALTKTIHDLNPKIERTQLEGSDPSALADLRDTALKELSGYLDLSVTHQPNGATWVSTSSGISLVGATAHELRYTGTGVVGTQTVFPDITIHRVNPADGVADPDGDAFTHNISGGTLRGLMDIRDRDLPELALELGNLSAALFDGLNAIHNNNSSVPAQNSLTGVNTGLLATDAHGFSGQTSFAIVDQNGALVTRVDVDFDAGNYSVDGAAATAFAGGTLGDIVAGINTGLGASGTLSFANGIMTLSAANSAHGVATLQDEANPSSRGGRGFSHFFGLNDLTTGLQPAHFDTGVNSADQHGFGGGQVIDFVLKDASGHIVNTFPYMMTAGDTFGDVVLDLNNPVTGIGTYATFTLDADGALKMTPTGTYAGLELHVQNDATVRGGTGKSFTQMFGLGERFQMEQAFDLDIAGHVKANQGALSLAKLDLAAATGPGSIVLSPSDNRGALDLHNMQNQRFNFEASGRIQAMTTTLGQYSAVFLADAGQRAAHADAFRESSQALNFEVESRLTNRQGVNLDEELSNMMVYQQSYNAAARMITTARELYDTLMRMV